MSTTNILEFATFCEAELDLHDKLVVKKLTDPNKTFYKSLPVCIIDAVFSIGVKYQHVEKAEKAFFDHFGLSISITFPIVNEYMENKKSPLLVYIEKMAEGLTHEKIKAAFNDSIYDVSLTINALTAEHILLHDQILFIDRNGTKTAKTL